jgi:hypothetical protein
VKTNSFIQKIIVAATLLLTSNFCRADIIPAQFVPGDKTIRLANGDQIAPEIASGGNVTLAVWQDKRALPGELPVPSFEWETSDDIYAVRIDASGKRIDRAPIPAFHTFSRPGTYTIALTVFGNRGGSGTSMQSIVGQ